MTAPSWHNPISVAPGQTQVAVDPRMLRLSRPDLDQSRIDLQLALRGSGQARHTPILVTADGVVVDGHHAVRAATEDGLLVDVRVVGWPETPSAHSILDLPVG